MATSLSKVQFPFREKGQTTCIHHQNRKLELYCETCRELACTKCLSTVHKSHAICDLSEITSKKKKDIQNFVDNTEKVDLVQIDQYITSTDAQLKENVSHFEKLSIELQTQTNKLKGDLDLLTAHTLSFYNQIEKDNAKLLETYKQDLVKYSTQLKQQVQECKIALQRGSDIQIYDTGCEIQSSATLPVKRIIRTTTFTPNPNPQNHLKKALGELNTLSQGHGLYVEASPSQQKSTVRKDVITPVYTLLPHAKVLGEWRSPYIITSICPTTDGQVWTSEDGSDTLTLLDRKGKVIQKVKHNTEITGINLSPTTNTLWVFDRKHNITELVSGRLVQRFRTRETPQCIGITATNNIIVGMANHISKFTTSGKLVLTTSVTGTRKPLVCHPHSMSECPVTHNVAVADWDSKRDGGEGKPRVVVIDTDFKELFIYRSQVSHTDQSTSKPGSKVFSPYGVVYDSIGNLVIGDLNNRCTLLISGRGEFLRIIHTDDYSPVAVGVDRDDVLWTVFWYNRVKLIQYTRALDKKQCIIS